MHSVHQIINKPIPSNCYVICDKENLSCIIVDPGDKDSIELTCYIETHKLLPQYIILTHEHFDHCWGVNKMVKLYSIPIVCSEECANNIRSEKKNCSIYYENDCKFVVNSKCISIESIDKVLQFAGNDLYFFNTPGHTDASICFSYEDYFFSGDTLIKDLRTVTKLPTGSKTKLKATKDVLLKMQGKGFRVLPGHGDSFELDSYNLDSMLTGPDNKRVVF